MVDSATGPISGYLFQFEKALCLLATLENSNDSVSIEKFDDVAIQNENDIVILTLQAKHSISPSGTTFEDTSTALWRTIQIWIEKIKAGLINNDAKFICATNKTIPETSLLKKIIREDFATVKVLFESLLKDQREKFKGISAKGKEGSSVKKTIKLITFALNNLHEFEIIKSNLSIDDGSVSLKDKFLIAIHMANDEYPEEAKQRTYQELYGWLINSSKAKWMNADDAVFSKRSFEKRLAICYKTPSIINAFFRTKKNLGSIDANSIGKYKDELFVKQIEDIKRNKSALQRKVDRAILDYFYHTIEMSYIIGKGDLTKEDFGKFSNECFEKWQRSFDNFVIKELEEYDEDEKMKLAISIFDSIMDTAQLKFDNRIEFTSDNEYVHNGTFLELSNLPKIGWHPEWETKYAKK